MSVAGSPVAGFARFLHLLSTHPWKDRPLVLDPSQELSASQFKAIHAQFDASKAEGHARGFTVCTPTDLGGMAWGQAGMSQALRQRLVKLASKSLQVLQVCYILCAALPAFAVSVCFVSAYRNANNFGQSLWNSSHLHTRGCLLKDGPYETMYMRRRSIGCELAFSG